MRPIKLTMSAFGPFRGVETIDFSLLGNSGVFLVAGKTGAGKTTIFDAISYALFGKKTGEDRKDDLVRSDYAGPDTQTFVELEFVHRNKKYTIRRNPDHEINKVKGEGTTMKQASVVLTPEDGAPIEKKRDVDEKIQEILGTDYQQFKQISMIAQGEFRKLLTAGSRERKAIFQKIFMTENYAALADLIQKRSGELSGKRKLLNSSITQYLSGIETGGEGEAQKALLEMSTADMAMKIDESAELLKEAVKDDRKAASALSGEIKEHEEKESEMRSLLDRIEQENKLIGELEESLEKLKSLEGKKEEIKNKEALLGRIEKARESILPLYSQYKTVKEKADEEQDELQGLEAEIEENGKELEELRKASGDDMGLLEKAEELLRESEELKREKDAFIKKEGILKDLADIKERIGALGRTLCDAEDVKKNHLLELEGYRNDISTLEDDTAISFDLEKKVEKAREIRADLTEEEKSDGFIKMLGIKVRKAEKAYLRARDEYDGLETKRLAEERRIEENRAGIMAESLIENEPCPVCGSVHHPSPAKIAGPVMSEVEFEKLSLKVADLRDIKDTKNKELISLRGEEEGARDSLFTVKKRVFKSLESLGIDGGLRRKEKLQDYLDDNETRLNEIRKKIKKNQDIRDSVIPLIEENIDIDEKTISSIRGERDALTVQAAEMNARLGELESCRFENLADYESAVKKAEESAEEIKAGVKKRAGEKEQLEKEKSNLDGRKTSVETALQKTLSETRETKKALDEATEANGFKDLKEVEELTSEDADLLRSEIREHEINTERTKAEIEAVRSRISTETVRDTADVKDKISKLGEETEELRDRRSAALARVKTNDRIVKNVVKAKGRLDRLEKEINNTENLRSLIRGTKSGISKISLEEYIQISGFEGIIKSANLRLGPMSGNQFELFRTEDTGKKSNMALSLEILDNYTGKKRAVSSLSGGESFKASLAMALGLSDYITAGLGGIDIDTLFIDEGFGSLDEQSLIDAVDMLTGLSTHGKLVGIISHRAELLERISRKIIINKSPGGSSIEMDLGE